VMAPATESMMSAVPRDRAGAGSAVNNTLRMVGGSLGVAVLGSVLANVYRSRLGDVTSQLPAPLRAGANESIGATLTAVGKAALESGAQPVPLGEGTVGGRRRVHAGASARRPASSASAVPGAGPPRPPARSRSRPGPVRAGPWR